ncbi:MAG TPA: hypothetical protein VEB86_08020 [Chryseosolibacter sp.]|nr:hypothetical protein [Chryseosolibacter sp.]
MTHEQSRHWKSIEQYELDDNTSALSFSDRLARENGWTREFTFRAIFEYKKFMFLICATNQSLTPSETVDQVWHLHLLYTRDYWKEFCPHVLKREVHHGPTKGGAKEQSKFEDWYALTLFHYRNLFGKLPPADIWPEATTRFAPARYRWIDLNKNWIIKKIF